MGRRVVAADLLPALSVDLRLRRLAGADEPLGDRALVDEEVRRRLARVVDPDYAGVGANPAGIADLAARLAVKRRAVEDDLDILSGLRLLDRAIRAEQGDDRPFGPLLLVAEEGRARPDARVELRPVARGILEMVR